VLAVKNRPPAQRRRNLVAPAIAAAGMRAGDIGRFTVMCERPAPVPGERGGRCWRFSVRSRCARVGRESRSPAHGAPPSVWAGTPRSTAGSRYRGRRAR